MTPRALYSDTAATGEVTPAHGQQPDSLTCPLNALADVLACAHQATEFSRGCGFSERAAWEIGIAVSELATNALRHAGGGSVVLRTVSSPLPGIEILARDSGPGIDDVDSAMIDDFSEGRLLSEHVSPTDREGLGSGLGAIQRLTDDFEIESSPGAGTTIRAFKRLDAATGHAATAAPSRPVLILGLGNAILCDDGVGINVARHIAEQMPDPNVVVKEAEVAGFALLDLLEGFDRAVVVDAVRLREGRPGDIVVFESSALEPSLHLVAGHQIDLPSAIEIGKRMGRPVPSLVHIVGVQVEDDRTFSETCTPAVEAAIPTAARIALRIAATGR